MKTVLCFGDSNTWGFIPGSGRRYPFNTRWTSVTARDLGPAYHILVEGLNGRTTTHDDPVEGDKNGARHLAVLLESHKPLDLVCIMIGTNDCKQRFGLDPRQIAQGAEKLVSLARNPACGIDGSAPAVLLVAPPPFHEAIKKHPVFPGGFEKSRECAPLFAEAARSAGARFLDAGQVCSSSPVDGVHLSEQNHQSLGHAMAREIGSILSS